MWSCAAMSLARISAAAVAWLSKERAGRPFDDRYSLTRRSASSGSSPVMTSSLFFCGACAGCSPELKVDEKLAQIPPLPVFCDADAGGTAVLDGMSEEPLPPMLVSDVMPPDVVEQPPKA